MTTAGATGLPSNISVFCIGCFSLADYFKRLIIFPAYVFHAKTVKEAQRIHLH